MALSLLHPPEDPGAGGQRCLLVAQRRRLQRSLECCSALGQLMCFSPWYSCTEEDLSGGAPGCSGCHHWLGTRLDVVLGSVGANTCGEVNRREGPASDLGDLGILVPGIASANFCLFCLCLSRLQLMRQRMVFLQRP